MRLLASSKGWVEPKPDTIPNAVHEHLTDVSDQQIKDVPVPDDIQEFYDDLGQPFFHSETKVQIETLSPLQIQVWNLHQRYKRLLCLKSQKIGISSMCILITLWHALKDCRGMELVINAQSDEQAKTHAQDLRRILMGSDKYRHLMITQEFTHLGLLKDEITKVHTIWLHNPTKPRMPTKIIIVGMSPGAILSHKRVAFEWSSDITISDQTPQRQNIVWAALMSRLANSQGPMIVECPARKPEGPIYETWDRFERQLEEGHKFDPKNDFYVEKFTYELGIRDGFFSEEFIEAEKRRLGSVFGTFYNADFFASESSWYKEGDFANITDEATNIFLHFNPEDANESDVTDD